MKTALFAINFNSEKYNRNIKFRSEPNSIVPIAHFS